MNRFETPVAAARFASEKCEDCRNAPYYEVKTTYPLIPMWPCKNHVEAGFYYEPERFQYCVNRHIHVREGLDLILMARLAVDFEVSSQTVARWADGSSVPAPRMRQLVAFWLMLDEFKRRTTSK